MSRSRQRVLVASVVLAGILFLLWTLAVQQGWTDTLDLHATNVLHVRLPHRLARPGSHFAQFRATSRLQRLGDVIDILGSAEVVVLLLLAFSLAQTLEVVLKLTVVHPDPSILAGHLTAANSYPSGHTLRMVFCAATVGFLIPRPLVLLGASLLVCATVFGLLYLGQHWLSDIVGGVLLGWMAASGAYLLSVRRGVPAAAARSGTNRRS